MRSKRDSCQHFKEAASSFDCSNIRVVHSNNQSASVFTLAHACYSFYELSRRLSRLLKCLQVIGLEPPIFNACSDDQCFIGHNTRAHMRNRNSTYLLQCTTKGAGICQHLILFHLFQPQVFLIYQYLVKVVNYDKLVSSFLDLNQVRLHRPSYF